MDKNVLMNKMIRIANGLDDIGMVKDASMIDEIMNKVAFIIKEATIWGLMKGVFEGGQELKTLIPEMESHMPQIKILLEDFEHIIPIEEKLRKGITIGN